MEGDRKGGSEVIKGPEEARERSSRQSDEREPEQVASGGRQQWML